MANTHRADERGAFAEGSWAQPSLPLLRATTLGGVRVVLPRSPLSLSRKGTAAVIFSRRFPGQRQHQASELDLTTALRASERDKQQQQQQRGHRIAVCILLPTVDIKCAGMAQAGGCNPTLTDSPLPHASLHSTRFVVSPSHNMETVRQSDNKPTTTTTHVKRNIASISRESQLITAWMARFRKLERLPEQPSCSRCRFWICICTRTANVLPQLTVV